MCACAQVTDHDKGCRSACAEGCFPPVPYRDLNGQWLAALSRAVNLFLYRRAHSGAMFWWPLRDKLLLIYVERWPRVLPGFRLFPLYLASSGDRLSGNLFRLGKQLCVTAPPIKISSDGIYGFVNFAISHQNSRLACTSSHPIKPRHVQASDNLQLCASLKSAQF